MDTEFIEMYVPLKARTRESIKNINVHTKTYLCKNKIDSPQ